MKFLRFSYFLNQMVLMYCFLFIKTTKTGLFKWLNQSLWIYEEESAEQDNIYL